MPECTARAFGKYTASAAAGGGGPPCAAHHESALRQSQQQHCTWEGRGHGLQRCQLRHVLLHDASSYISMKKESSTARQKGDGCAELAVADLEALNWRSWERQHDFATHTMQCRHRASKLQRAGRYTHAVYVGCTRACSRDTHAVSCFSTSTLPPLLPRLRPSVYYLK